MTRIVGTRNRSEFILDPAEALRRGAELDQMWAALRAPYKRGVMRAPHWVFNVIDDLRQLEQARRVNKPAPVSSEPKR